MRRPRAGDPVRLAIAWRACWQAGENIDSRHPAHLCQADCLAEDFVGSLGDIPVRSDRVPMAAEPADDHPAAFDRFQICFAFILAGQQFIHIAVVGTGQAAGADLHRRGAIG